VPQVSVFVLFCTSKASKLSTVVAPPDFAQHLVHHPHLRLSLVSEQSCSLVSAQREEV
jgi:hypothetical protein